ILAVHRRTPESLQGRQPTVQLFCAELRSERELPRASGRLTEDVPHLERCGGVPQDQRVFAAPGALFEIAAAESAARRAGLQRYSASGFDVLAKFLEQSRITIGHSPSLSDRRVSI